MTDIFHSSIWMVELVHPNAIIPNRVYKDDAGYDLYTCMDHSYNSLSSVVRFNIGIKIQPPTGWWFEITGRSSTRDVYNLSVRRSVIDGGYRGEIYILADVYDTLLSRMIPAGSRIAQMIPHRYESIVWEEKPVDTTSRGSRGFGSSGS